VQCRLSNNTLTDEFFMNSTIKAVVVACCLQIVVTLSMSVYLFDRANSRSEFLATLAQANAASYTDNVSLRYYNQTQQERSAEREDLHEWVDKRIDLRLAQDHMKHQLTGEQQ
jgi:hypothetical protein